MIKSLFNEKEKELAMAVSKVEELTTQLEEIRSGRINGLNSGDNRNNSPAYLELEKLRKELMVGLLWRMMAKNKNYCYS